MKPTTLMIMTIGINLTACQVDTTDLAQFTHIEPQNQAYQDTIKEYVPDSNLMTGTPPVKPPARDPFSPIKPIRTAEKPPVIKIHNHPVREPLEAYPLNTLHWVGTLRQNQQLWALIQTHEGTLHRIQQGAYLGENGGQLMVIETTRLSIKEVEVLSDGTRHDYIKYLERKAEK